MDRINNNLIQLTGWAESTSTQERNDIPWEERWINSDCSITEEEERKIAEAVQAKQLTIVSNGSYCDDHKYGTAGWVIETQDRQCIVKGSIITPGQKEVQCPHRSELAGMLSGIYKVQQICKKYQTREGEVTVGCDGKGAIDALNYDHEIIKSSRKHYDIILAITNIMKESDIKWNRTHIKGHQDDLFEFHQLTRLEQLNVAADLIAKERLQTELSKEEYIREFNRPKMIYKENCAIFWINQQGQREKISTHLQKTLTYNIQQTKIRKYWKAKKKFSAYTERKIDWEHTHKAMKGPKRCSSNG